MVVLILLIVLASWPANGRISFYSSHCPTTTVASWIMSQKVGVRKNCSGQDSILKRIQVGTSTVGKHLHSGCLNSLCNHGSQNSSSSALIAVQSSKPMLGPTPWGGPSCHGMQTLSALSHTNATTSSGIINVLVGA